jgi:hypothetical protein
MATLARQFPRNGRGTQRTKAHSIRISRLSGWFRRIGCIALPLLWAASAFPLAAASPEGGTPVPRRILVLHGWDPKAAEKPSSWPADTMTAELFQTPLEWLGYEVEYLDIGKSPLPSPLPERFAAVLLDGEAEIPAVRESQLAGWLLQARKRGALLLFTGSFPFSGDDAMQMLGGELGFRGTGQFIPHASKIQIDKLDREIMESETPVLPRKSEFRDLQAPERSRVLVSLKGQDALGKRVRYEPVFLANWGGMWLEPYVTLRASADNYLYYADPYKLLAAWLEPLGIFPAPDTSTRDGRRIFYSHIDGDGFASLAQFKGHPLCAEVIRDRVLQAFPLPVTVSVIEAEIRGLVEGVDTPPDKLTDIARSIFALPNVQPASHAFSHPYIWEPKDPNPGIYDEPCLAMKAAPKFPAFDLDQEIRGSVDFIDRQLLPPGRKCGLFLWSGNCRPGPAAIRKVREVGLENLNGGNTIISHLYPGIAGVAPRTMEWDGELQVNASNQNEFMYANGFNGPFYGGFADVIDTFERTGSPRRLKPVNAYYHFYSATYLSSLRALEKIHRWVMEHKLHSVTALEFVKLTKDSRDTRITALGPRHWRVANEGVQRTFRLPASAGRPDLARCKGVTGWSEHEGQLYFHTQGLPQAEIVLSSGGEPVLPHSYLAESSATVHWIQFSPQKLELEAEDLRPVEMIFGGCPPGSSCDITVNSQFTREAADSRGFLKLSLPPKARVVVDTQRSSHAAAR